jgi:hypothetical protein
MQRIPSTKTRAGSAIDRVRAISAGASATPSARAATAASTDRIVVLASPLSSRLRSPHTMPKSRIM